MEGPEVVFGWRVSSVGYRWEGELLVDNRHQHRPDRNGMSVLVVEPGKDRVVCPLETPTLARRFADLAEGDAAGLLAFAAEWGPLTGGESGLEWPRFERWDLWREAIRGLRRVFELNDAIARLSVKPGEKAFGDESSRKAAKTWLSERVSWASGGGAVTFEDSFLRRTIRPTDTAGLAELWRVWRKNDAVSRKSVLAAARALRMTFTNELMDTDRLRALLPVPTEGIEPPPALFMPETLKGALYLQAFLEITGRTNTRRCAGCGEWFDATELRRDVRFNPAHGSRCSVRAYRRGDTKRPKGGAGE